MRNSPRSLKDDSIIRSDLTFDRPNLIMPLRVTFNLRDITESCRESLVPEKVFG